MERVTTLEGDIPVLIIAPHGPNDYNTAYIAEKIATQIEAFAVINNGWERAPTVDFLNDQANCNDVRHIHEEVVIDEFFNPILRYTNRIAREYSECVQIYIIHGCGNYVKNLVNDSLDLIVGYGAGKPSSYSCDPWLKDCFIHQLNLEKFNVYQGKAGGNFAGRAKNNLNQLYRKWYPRRNVHSMQLEIVRSIRVDNVAETTALLIASAIKGVIHHLNNTNEIRPISKTKKKI